LPSVGSEVAIVKWSYHLLMAGLWRSWPWNTQTVWRCANALWL